MVATIIPQCEKEELLAEGLGSSQDGIHRGHRNSP